MKNPEIFKLDLLKKIPKAVVFFAALIFTGLWGLGDLEFFRHTEADRTLISWEMLERHDFLVPHLISSEIFTKPPLFYWLQAGIFYLSGSINEFYARLPSQLALISLFIIQLYFNRRFKTQHPLEAAIISVTSIGLLVSSRTAEIDMLYVTLTCLALNLLYCGSIENKKWATIGAYLTLSSCFLTKGPPAILFFFTGLFAILVNKKWKLNLKQHGAGILFFIFIIGAWLLLLINRVGWIELSQTFYEEIIYRAINEKRLERGYFYYLYSSLFDLAPWSLLILFSFFQLKNYRTKNNDIFQNFNLAVFSIGLIFLSLMSGKSNRYLAPVYPFAVNLLTPFIVERAKILLDYKKQIVWGLALSFIIFIGVLHYWKFEYHYSLVFFLVALIAFKNIKDFVLGFGILILFVNAGFSSFFVPYRNSRMSVKADVKALKDILIVDPAFNNEVINIEFFDRWTNYYLKHEGINTVRLERNLKLKCEANCYLILSDADEDWRLEEIARFGYQTKILYNFNSPSKQTILISIPKAAAEKLKVRKLFPTKPSAAYFKDR